MNQQQLKISLDKNLIVLVDMFFYRLANSVVIKRIF